MATTTPNFGWPVPTSTDLVKDGATAIEALGDGIDASLVDLRGGTTGQILAKATNTDMDFAWITNDVGDITAVTAGTGISGGGTSGAVTVTNSMATTMTTKGDLVPATGSGTFARLAAGNNGETLIADSSEATGLRYNPQNALSNPVINGGMEIAQRGTAAVTLTAAAFQYPVDRWQAIRSSGVTGATAQQISSIGLTNFNNAVRIQRTAANTATDDLSVAQNFETPNSIAYAGRTVTLSFWARAGANFSSPSGAIGVRLYSGTGTDQSGFGFNFTGTATPISTNQVITTSWVRYAVTGTVASTATQLQIFFFYTPSGTAGAADSFDVTGVQLDLGTYTSLTAPAFRRNGATTQGELAACKRYLPSVSPADAIGYAYGTDLALYHLPFDVQARVAPTGVTLIGTYQAYALNVGSTVTPAFNLGKVSGASVTAGLTITAGQGSRLQAQSTATILFTGCEL